MRITFVVPVLDSGGGARIIAGHAKRLVARGHEVTIVAPVPEKLSLRQKVKIALGREKGPSDPAQSHIARSGVPIVRVPRDRLTNLDSYPNADAIIATFWITAEWITQLLPTKGAKVYFIQGYEDFPGIPKDRLDATWRSPMAKIAVSQWLVDLGREQFNSLNIALVPNSIEHDIFEPSVLRQDRQRTVGFLYSSSPSKDIGTTLAAIERVRVKMPEAMFVSFGTTEPGRAFPPYVAFERLPPQTRIADIYRRCSVWLSTSLSEGFNLPPLEAMATGCPAVCSKTGRPLEIVRDGFNGYLVEQGDVDGFANALLTVLSLSEADWQEMSNHAIESVAHPTWDESSRLFEEALQAIVERTHS